VRRCVVRAMYLGASVVAVSTWGAISSARPLPLPLWSAVQHIPWVDRYSGGASQDCMPLPWAQKVCIYGVIQ